MIRREGDRRVLTVLILAATLSGACDKRGSYNEESRTTGTLGSSPGAISMSDRAMTMPAPDGERGRLSTDSSRGETYARTPENPFVNVRASPLSTFSIDVDAASYSNVRRYIEDGTLPPADAVRVEELINYFHYDYPQPTDEHPFSITTDVAACPWSGAHQLVLVGLQGKRGAMEDLPPSNLVFLIDVSGSMQSPDKLPLLKSSFRYLVEKLRDIDKISIVVYAGGAGLVLPPTSGDDRVTILNAIDNLEAGGSTAGGEGIALAYKTALQGFTAGGNNRIILATDGDFNVGVSDYHGLERLIEEKRNMGVFLTVLGLGTGNMQDQTLELLADKGNGHYAYLDDEDEARKVFQTELTATLFTIASDVKVQVEFNPLLVSSYRLIGYDNRRLSNEDFADDHKDAGELGSGHNVTALYEIVPTQAATGDRPDLLTHGADGNSSERDERMHRSRFQRGELLRVSLRYKPPTGGASRLVAGPAISVSRNIREVSENLRFAAAVAQWGLLLRNSPHKGSASYDGVIALAEGAVGSDTEGYRDEFIELVALCRSLASR